MRKMSLASLTITLASLVVATAGHAAGGQEVTTEFYSDASKTTLVGEVIVGCGANGHWGKRTAFTAHSSSPCNGLRRNAATSIAATSLLHFDPVAACKFRCSHIPLQACPPPSANTPECVQPRDICTAGCDEILTAPDE